MDNPDWYRDWRHDAVHQLQGKKAQELEAQFKLGTWPRYDYDVDTGTLIFFRERHCKGHSRNPDRRDDERQGRQLALVLGQCALAGGTDDGRRTRARIRRGARDRRTVPGLCSRREFERTGMGIDGRHGSDHRCSWAYRPPDAGGAPYLTYKSIMWASFGHGALSRLVSRGERQTDQGNPGEQKVDPENGSDHPACRRRQLHGERASQHDIHQSADEEQIPARVTGAVIIAREHQRNRNHGAREKP